MKLPTPMQLEEDLHAELLRRHAAARAAVGGDGIITLLHIGPALSGVATGGARVDVRLVRLALGYAAVPATLFRSDVPTALELENAIAAVEDQVMPAVRQLGGVTELVTMDPELRSLIPAGPENAAEDLPLERIEWLFDELARATLGGPSSGAPFTITRQSAAALLILREFMHHGGIRLLRRPALFVASGSR